MQLSGEELASTLRYDDPLVKSPTRTVAWLKCPQYAAYSKVTGAPVTEPILRGRFTADLIKAHYSDQPPPLAKDPGYEDVAIAVYTAIAETESRLLAQHMAVELPLGPCRLDQALYRAQDDTHIVVDYKYTRTLVPGDAPKRVEQYHRSHQLLHYAWAYSQYVGTWYSMPATPMILVINLFSDRPQPYSFLYQQSFTLVQIKKWLANAIRIWYNIDMIQDAYRNESQCIGTYGKCPYYDRCHGESRE